MRVTKVLTLAPLALALALALCAATGCGSSGSSHRDVTGVTGPDGTAAVFHAGALPTPQGSLTVTVPQTGNAINGGSTQITVVASGNIVKIFVAVRGQDGYWEVAVPAGSTAADVLLTLAQQLPNNINIVFEVGDAAGNVSAPATMNTLITQVGTGDLQVSVSWDVDNDIDLHVTDPKGFEVYFGSDNSPEGGELDLDSNPLCNIDGVNNENIRWPSGKAPHGSYTVVVDNFEACMAVQVHYVVTVQKTGQTPMTYTGMFAADDPGDTGIGGTMVAQFNFP